MRSLILTLCALSLAATVEAAPARWSLDRASFGLQAAGAITETEGTTSAFLPGAYLSYSLTSQMSLAGIIERDFAGHLTIGRLGLRFPIAYMGEGRLAAGINLVGYGDQGAEGITSPTSWDASLHGSWPVMENAGTTVLWGIASASYDPENARQTYRVGLRFQGIGGKPY